MRFADLKRTLADLKRSRRPLRTAHITQSQHYEMMLFYSPGRESSLEEERSFLDAMLGKDFVDECLETGARVHLEIVEKEGAEE